MPTFLSLPSSSRIPAILGTAIMCSIAGLSPALSETRIETVLGTVTKVDTLTSTYTVKTPKDERICEIRDVPIYSEGQKSDELGSMIIGGLLGSAVGNKLSDNNGAGAAGAVAGALLGRSQANKNAKSGEIVGYRQQESCETKRVILEEVRSKITGYRVQVEADGRILNLETSSPLGLNDRVELRKQVSYSLR
ncbi:MAG: hypothetical protein ACPH9D_07090 [Candidatus Puniceispirillaceae bacterium]|jgi:uncharacterized protein YcfJ